MIFSGWFFIQYCTQYWRCVWNLSHYWRIILTDRTLGVARDYIKLQKSVHPHYWVWSLFSTMVFRNRVRRRHTVVLQPRRQVALKVGYQKMQFENCSGNPHLPCWWRCGAGADDLVHLSVRKTAFFSKRQGNCYIQNGQLLLLLLFVVGPDWPVLLSHLNSRTCGRGPIGRLPRERYKKVLLSVTSPTGSGSHDVRPSSTVVCNWTPNHRSSF